MDLFEDFDLNEKKGYLHKKRENEKAKDEQKFDFSKKKEEKVFLEQEQNPDLKIENRLKGLIDDKDLLKGKDEINLISKEVYEVIGCNHVIFIPKNYLEKENLCKFYI